MRRDRVLLLPIALAAATGIVGVDPAHAAEAPPVVVDVSAHDDGTSLEVRARYCSGDPVAARHRVTFAVVDEAGGIVARQTLLRLSDRRCSSVGAAWSDAALPPSANRVRVEVRNLRTGRSTRTPSLPVLAS